jgi:hypothetical protein
MKKNKKRNWLSKIKNTPESFKAVPEHLKNVEFCLAAVKKNGPVLEYVPESLKTEAVCIAAVEDYGGALQYVPESLKTEAMCLAALNKTLRVLKYVPENLKVKLSSIFTIRLTKDEIDVINVWAKYLRDSNENEVIEIRETIWKENKEFLIDSSTQSKLLNIRCIADAFYAIEGRIEFSVNNTKAILYYSRGAGPLCGTGWKDSFSKEDNIWKKTDTRFIWIS